MFTADGDTSIQPGRHSVSATPAMGAPAQADNIHSIRPVTQLATTPNLSDFNMRAFVVNQLNHPSKIELTKDAPEPKPVHDQLLVDVYSAGLNFFDVSAYSDCLNPGLNESAINGVSFPRFCRLKGNIRFNPNSRSPWVQSLPVSFRKARPLLRVVRTNRETGCLGTPKARMRIGSWLIPSNFCPSQRT